MSSLPALARLEIYQMERCSGRLHWQVGYSVDRVSVPDVLTALLTSAGLTLDFALQAASLHFTSFYLQAAESAFVTYCESMWRTKGSLGYESCLETPQRYLYTKKLLKTKRAPWRWRYWGAMMACITLNKHKICNMSESASFKFWGIDTRYKASLLCYVSHTADTTHFLCLAEERLHSLPLSWQIRGFRAPGLRKLSWDTPEVLVHEETFEDKTGAMAMAILRGMMAKWQYCLHMWRLYESGFSKMLKTLA